MNEFVCDPTDSFIYEIEAAGWIWPGGLVCGAPAPWSEPLSGHFGGWMGVRPYTKGSQLLGLLGLSVFLSLSFDLHCHFVPAASCFRMPRTLSWCFLCAVGWPTHNHALDSLLNQLGEKEEIGPVGNA